MGGHAAAAHGMAQMLLEALVGHPASVGRVSGDQDCT
jgi:hypothetical protein